jgi:hypothetical protein
MYPEDCLQKIIKNPKDWWGASRSSAPVRGSLIFAFVHQADHVPYSFEPVGRATPTEHKQAVVKVSPLKVDQPLKQVDLPVAAMPLHGSEVWVAYRAKKRPCLVLSTECPAVDGALVRGMPKHSSAPTMLVAPYYGVDQNGLRAGFNPQFVERIRHCEYPQYMWDMLPHASATKESILRLDQIQPIGRHHDSFKLSGYQLCDEALGLLDSILQWQIWGGLSANCDVLAYKNLMSETFST